jgi:hypothetical protein
LYPKIQNIYRLGTFLSKIIILPFEGPFYPKIQNIYRLGIFLSKNLSFYRLNHSFTEKLVTLTPQTLNYTKNQQFQLPKSNLL